MNEEISIRLMAYLDGEMPAGERAAFEQLLEAHPEWRSEVAGYAAIVGAERQLAVRPAPPETWDRYWEEIDSRLGRKWGQVLALSGAALLLALGAFKVWLFATHPMAKLGLALILAGGGMLFVMVLRGRLAELPRDRYRHIRK